MFITSHKTQLKMNQIPQNKTRYNEPGKENMGNGLEYIDTDDSFLNNKPS